MYGSKLEKPQPIGEPTSGIVSSSRFRVTGRALCLTGAMVGAVGLIGWLVDWPFLTTLIPNEPAMKANTAVGLFLVA